MADGAEQIVVWQRAVARAQGSGASLSAWSKQVAARFAAAGGEVLAHLSGTVVASFPASDVGDAVEVALDLLEDAEDAGLTLSFGVALGELERDGELVAGQSIEAAESLAVRARAGEVLLDPAARERARGLFLFARTVGGGAQQNRAASIDRTHPRRDTATAAIARLGPIALTPATEALLPMLRATLGSDTPVLVLLRGPVGAGAVELIAAARTALSPASVIDLGAATSGLAPLGSLRAALARDPGTELLLTPLTPGERAPLERLRRGELVPRELVCEALALAIDRAGGVVWFVLSPLVAIDPATLAVVSALKQGSRSVACIARVGIDTPLPPELDEIADRVELTLPPLRTSDARVVAESVLGEATPAEVARRVAVLGGDTPVSVLEAARALIGAGDLILDVESEDRRFVWRNAPRGGVKSIALDALLAERIEQLDDESRRVLELVTWMPEWAPRGLLDTLAAADGLRPRATPRGLDRLTREGWITMTDAPRPSTSFLRRFVGSASPPARTAEVHRFVAAALEPSDEVLDRAERAIHLVLGGRELDGLTTLVTTAEGLRDAGYPGAAAQIALVVLGTGMTGEVGARAHAIAAGEAPRPVLPLDGGVESFEASADRPSVEIALPPDMVAPDMLATAPAAGGAALAPVPTEPRTETVALDEGGPDDDRPDPESQLHLELREAIRQRDFEALDRLAERAIAVGSDMQAVARIRAIAAALRGDLAGAQQRLARMRRGDEAPRDRRALLAEAMVALRAGQNSPAMRLALRALGDARRAADERGEAVALFTLAACFRAAGLPNDAALLESRADT